METVSPERMQIKTIDITVVKLQRSFRTLVTQEDLEFQQTTNNLVSE